MRRCSPETTAPHSAPRLRLPIALLLLATAVLSSGGGLAQQQDETKAGRQPSSAPGIFSLLPADATTEQEIDLAGGRLAYNATAGTLALRDQQGERLAAVFYTAYSLKEAAADNRPITFVFNGGPGASSAYLHLGLVGPRIVDYGPRADATAAQLRDNPDSWLEFTDLVLIDPVGTGWSRAADSDKAESFWGVERDARALAKFIALYLAENGRTAAPKYLLGESYGGFRAVKVARALSRQQGMIVSGIVMVSPFLEGRLHFGGGRFALNAALLLPSIAAAELDRTDRFSADALEAVERFAMSDYLVTLAGPPPRGAAAQAFYARLAEMTGLPAEVVARTRGFIRDAYVNSSGGEAGELLSLYDATHRVPDPFPETLRNDGGDPVLDGYLQSLGGIFVGYAREELDFRTEMTYELLNGTVSREWRWGNHGGSMRLASANHDLRELLALHPGFGVLIAHGRSDLVTPYGISRYLLDHLPEHGLAARARLAIYKGGHMFYFDPEARADFTAAARAFYEVPAP